MEFWRCAAYLALVGIAAFAAGRLLPKRWFRADRFPFRPMNWERGGRVYEKLKIRRWHKRLPDMSRILPGVMPSKSLEGDWRERLPEMIRETCVAEVIHGALCLVSLRCLRLWRGAGGLLAAGLGVLGNLTYVIIQRYNRPRLIRLLEKCIRQEEFGRCEENVCGS